MFSGVADLKKVFERARFERLSGHRTLLFVDEIHRFNRAQQDGFLPVMEDGTVVLVGATTENPSFELNAALLSRAQVLRFEPLSLEDLAALAARAEEKTGTPLPLDAEARATLLDAGRRRRARPARADRGGHGGDAARRNARYARAAGGRAAAGADLRQEAGRPLQPDLGAAQDGARLRSRRGALLFRAHDRCGRGPAVPRAAADPHGGGRYRHGRSAGAAARHRRPRCLRDAGHAGGRTRSGRGRRLSRRGAEIERRLHGVRSSHGARQADRLADAAHGDPQRPHKADEGRGGTAAATSTTTTRPKAFPGRNISRKSSAGRSFTVPSSAVSSARSPSASTTSRSYASRSRKTARRAEFSPARRAS